MSEKQILDTFRKFDGRIFYVDGYVIVANSYKYGGMNPKQIIGAISRLKGLPKAVFEHPAVQKMYMYWSGKKEQE